MSHDQLNNLTPCKRAPLQRDPAIYLAVVPLVLLSAVISKLSVDAPASVWRWEWVPSLGVDISFRFDGLNLLFGLLISGIGTLIFIYAPAYLGRHRDRWRLYAWLLLFMLAMLGLVFAENLLLLFVFWELTSITSYMLIGFKHEDENARASALQALLVTGLGGLALLAGFVLLRGIVGSFELSDVLARGDILAAHPYATACCILILLGVLTKSAQVPFHFWLPSAMVAPTPVSAYLHSATMVKAGVFLVARLQPVTDGIVVWENTLLVTGAITALAGGAIAITQRDLKRILAYSTVSSLGMMILLLGVGTPVAIKSALVLLVCHSFYKAALFMVAGTIDHEIGTRDIRRLSGIAAVMPGLAVAAVLAACSQAGVPPTAGFLAKELTYESALATPQWRWLVLTAAIIGNVTYVAVAGLVVAQPFFAAAGGRTRNVANSGGRRRIDRRLVVPAVFLGILGLFPTFLAKPLFAPAYAAILPNAEPMSLKLWHGFNLPVFLSLLTIIAGATLVWSTVQRRRLRLWLRQATPLAPSTGYEHGLSAVKMLAAWQTRVLQPGKLRLSILTVLVAFVVLLAFDFCRRVAVPQLNQLLEIRLHELFIPALILAGIGLALTSNSRVAAVCALGVIGYAIAMLFVMYGAPDLAMTQFAIETLTVVLFVFVLARLPRFANLSDGRARRRDMLVALAGGTVMAAITWAATAAHVPSRVTEFFAGNSLALAKGRNLVNVILVDFRGLDTLGEIVVLSIAAIGISSLIRAGRSSDRKRASNNGRTVDARQQIEASLPAHLGAGSFRLLSSATNYMLPLLLMFSIFLLLRGHNEPGGGFVGGLVAAAALALFAMTFGVTAARQLQGWTPRAYLGTGLTLAVIAGLVGLCNGAPFLTGTWTELELPAIGKLGTPLLFDVGVFLVVIGMATMIIYELAEYPLAAPAKVHTKLSAWSQADRPAQDRLRPRT